MIKWMGLRSRQVNRSLTLIFLIVSILVLVIVIQEHRTTMQPPEQAGTDNQESIGTAQIQPDGTIILRLRAVTGGTVGDGTLVYGPDSPDYQSILAHIGSIKPGETKPVRPWQ